MKKINYILLGTCMIVILILVSFYLIVPIEEKININSTSNFEKADDFNSGYGGVLGTIEVENPLPVERKYIPPTFISCVGTGDKIYSQNMEVWVSEDNDFINYRREDSFDMGPNAKEKFYVLGKFYSYNQEFDNETIIETDVYQLKEKYVGGFFFSPDFDSKKPYMSCYRVEDEKIEKEFPIIIFLK